MHSTGPLSSQLRLSIRPSPVRIGIESLGGISSIRAADLDAALTWARKLSQATTVPIEVWPFHDQPQ
jgi:hypothetical protein